MPIPSPEYVFDALDGTLYQMPGQHILVVGTVPDQLIGQYLLHRGPLILRYGISTLVPPDDAVIPGLMAAERGGILVGREAWHYLLARFQLHARAEVVGIGLSGQSVQKYVRELDFAVPPRVFAYANQQDSLPLGEVKALIIGQDAPPMPELLEQYLPTVDNLDALVNPNP